MAYRPIPTRDELKYLRREGNRRVRAQRRRRTALRWTIASLIAATAVGLIIAAGVWGVRWVLSPEHFRLETVSIRGAREARTGEIEALLADWRGRNIFTISLPDVEMKVREHPWIGTSGGVRVQRRIPGSLLIAVQEREAGGLALVGQNVWLLDTHGMPIDRYGPRYARFEFPIIKGVDHLDNDDRARLKEALASAVEVTSVLARREPAFYSQISEIDMGRPGMIAVRLQGESYDLRLSREQYLKNLDNYFAMKEEISRTGKGAIAYVDLRWQDRIAVMPAAAVSESNGGR